MDFYTHGDVRDLKSFAAVDAAITHIRDLYTQSVQAIEAAYDALLRGEEVNMDALDACYPYVGVNISPESIENVDATLAFGMVDSPGSYGITLTKPALFQDYYAEQLMLIQKNHGCEILVGRSRWPIPLPFIPHLNQGTLTEEQTRRLKHAFHMPDLSRINDDIANAALGTGVKNFPLPLALFTGERIDYSLDRLHHYTGTDPKHFQKFILLTNYQRYIEPFQIHGYDVVSKNEDYTEFVAPGDVVTRCGESGLYHEGITPTNLPQMPAYHLKRPDGQGITFINIGVGPTNAKNITDHLAVLRPHCWVMLGHCAGLQNNQELGDYAMAHAYVRDDKVLDDDLPPTIPLPPIAEVQVALQTAVANITQQTGRELKSRMRTGTIITTDNRSWELRFQEIFTRFRQSRAIALDMESATIAGNGFRFRVPYGTLLCVSDKPIHGELKLRGMANTFYKARVERHLLIGIEAIKLLQQNTEQLHSRKLRSFDEPPFR